MRYSRKVRLKQALGHLVTCTGWPLIQRRLARAGVLVLTYHGIARGVEDSYVNRQSVEAGTFDAQLAWLSRRYRCIRLSEVVEALENRRALPARAVALTFDDGLRNVLGSALPVLSKYDVPATVFVCSDWVGRGPLWTDEVNLLVVGASCAALVSPCGDGRVYRLQGLAARERAAQAIRVGMKRLAPVTRAEAVARLRKDCAAAPVSVVATPECHDLLSWDEVRALARAGVEVGSHGASHTVLTALHHDEARQEIVRSKETIEREVGAPCTLFSYPNGTAGDFGSDHQQMLLDAGFRAAVTQIAGVNGTGSPCMALRRVNVSRVPSLAYFQTAISRAGW